MSGVDIVVGFIPTAEGWAAIHSAAREAMAAQGGRLVVVNSSHGDAPSDRRRAQEADVERLHETLGCLGVKYEFEQPVRRRDAAAEILETAQTRSANRIVIGVRRRTPVGKLILGSTAQQVILGADCPVLAVKPVSG